MNQVKISKKFKEFVFNILKENKKEVNYGDEWSEKEKNGRKKINKRKRNKNLF